MERDLHVSYPEPWTAVHDLFNKQLRITGDVVVEHGGYAISMKRKAPQGFNPEILLMEIRFTPTPDSESEQQVHYEEPWDDDSGVAYKEVDFLVAGSQTVDSPPSVKVTDIRRP